MRSGSQPAALTLLDPRQGHIAFQLQKFTLAAGSVFSERSNYFNARWIKTGSGAWDLDLATLHFLSPVLLFGAPYQNALLRSQEPISGVVLVFMPSFFVLKLTMKRSDATVSCLTTFTGRRWPDWRRMTRGLSMLSFEQMQAELGFGALATAEILVSYLKIFLIKATRLKLDQDASAEDTFAPRIPPILDRLKTLIEKHYRSKHRPADYAKMVGMNPRALGELSRTYFHKTLTDLIRERILKHAKWQLLHTLRPVKEVAYEVGFDDEFYFSRLFKCSTGCSPQFYREYETEIRGGKNLLPADKVESMRRS